MAPPSNKMPAFVGNSKHDMRNTAYPIRPGEKLFIAVADMAQIVVSGRNGDSLSVIGT
jgi:hypothetical protein